RLGTDWIDLYQIHRWDPGTDHDETLGALTDLVRAGKVRYLGSSTDPPSEIVAAQWVAEKPGPERLVCEEPPYSMLGRGAQACVPGVRPRRDPVGPARRRLVERSLAKGARAADEHARRSHPVAVRPLAPREPAQARRCRGARAARRAGGDVAHPPCARLRDPA